ncbi:hypothetical protein JBL43_06760 [Aureibaculum sp. A20]|uniref:Tetratricopeptide repeat protein n=1 Tax=Aureibaculum flavum TaxID=2795986 RepID=A0ABS0WPS9_9FLAO|nr:hypothetical protein [Aureibaculum flavum]MBJ2173931.1 hypothetical protein [Aureibaculum flavum]
MTKHLQLLILLSLLIIEGVFSQKDTTKINSNFDCKKNLLEFVEYTKAKKYGKAYKPWLLTFKNCPEYSIQIYTYGLKIVEHKYENSYNEDKENAGLLIDSIFRQRIQYFPKNSAKAYSDWAISLRERGTSNDAVFEKLELAFKADPIEMSIKNLVLYFKEITDRNKDFDPQIVFDTYDYVMDAVHHKMDMLSVELDRLNEKAANGEALTAKEKLKQKNNTIHLRGLSQVEPILDQTHGPLADCNRLIQLYKIGYKTNKTNATWLKRGITRLYRNDCENNKLYPKMVKAWKVADESIFAKLVYNNLFPNESNSSGWLELRKRIDAEKDPYKKAGYLLKIAYLYKRKSKSISRSYAIKALEVRPSYGDAYLLRANLYASSANSCGDDEFSKRLVYVAAADKAKKAKEVDPSVTAKAERYIDAYTKNAPGRSTICFPSKESKDKTSFEIKCWIDETVTFNPYKN